MKSFFDLVKELYSFSGTLPVSSGSPGGACQGGCCRVVVAIVRADSAKTEKTLGVGMKDDGKVEPERKRNSINEWWITTKGRTEILQEHSKEPQLSQPRVHSPIFRKCATTSCASP